MRELVTTIFEVLGLLVVASAAAVAATGDLATAAGLGAGGVVLVAESALLTVSRRNSADDESETR